MLVLNRNEIKNLIDSNQIISEFIDLDTQLTPNGFDVTLKEVYRIESSGHLDFSNKERKMPDFTKLQPIKKEGDEHGWWVLPKGTYKIKANEHFKIPLDLITLAKPRSSLLRMGGTVYTGVGDAGFEGKMEFLLNVTNEKGISLKENARIVQIIFLKMNKIDEGYSGIHKHLE